MEEPTTKRCPRCDGHLPLENFGKHAAQPDGLQLHCRSCRREQQREYRARHPDKMRELGRNQMRRRRQADPEGEADYMRRWRAANQDLIKASKAEWESANYERVREYARAAHRRWKKRNPDALKVQDLLRRARKVSASVGEVDLLKLRAERGESCGICHRAIDFAIAWPDPASRSIDHIVPLALGGPHEQSNLQFAHLICNIRKGASLTE